MVKHIVLFKLTSFRDEGDKALQLDMLEKSFSVLPSRLDYIIEYRTKRNITAGTASWDFAIDSVFATKADLERYQVSDEHSEAIKNASVIKKEKAILDYEYQIND
ncbi:MAG: Dabb family protein [Bacteroidales bacterium]